MDQTRIKLTPLGIAVWTCGLCVIGLSCGMATRLGFVHPDESLQQFLLNHGWEYVVYGLGCIGGYLLCRAGIP